MYNKLQDLKKFDLNITRVLYSLKDFNKIKEQNQFIPEHHVVSYEFFQQTEIMYVVVQE